MNRENIFAKSDWRNRGRTVGISREDRRLHTGIVGRTGMGKSGLLQNMILHDLHSGEGLTFIDPHGDVVDGLLDYVPRNRIEDVIYINPTDNEYPIPLNPLDLADRTQKHLLASGLMSIFEKLFGHTWQVRQEHIARSAVLTLLESGDQHSLLDVYRLLTDWRYRKSIVSRVRDPMLDGFWRYEFRKLTAQGRGEAFTPLLNKLGPFLTYPLVRKIVGHSKNTFAFRDVMDSGRIVLVNLSKGQLGEDVSSFLGSLIVLNLHLAALSRSDVPESTRLDHYLYLDEAASFTSTRQTFEAMLSESRKYRLSLIIAFQYLDQFEEDIRAALFGNIGTLIAFPVGPEDAKSLERHFSPQFTAEDLVAHRKYHMYLRLAIDGHMSKPFSANALQPFAGRSTEGCRDVIVQRTRARYSINPAQPPHADSEAQAI